MTEGEVKAVCEDYLEILQNQGKLMYLRLNSGSWLLPNSDGTMRRVKGCPKGTADIEVLQDGRCIFIELKGEHGVPSKEQWEFEYLAHFHGAEYHVVHSLEELQEVIGLCGR